MPGNDDAIRSVRLFCKLVADSVIEGVESAKGKNAAGVAAEAAEQEIALTDAPPAAAETAEAPAQ